MERRRSKYDWKNISSSTTRGRSDTATFDLKRENIEPRCNMKICFSVYFTDDWAEMIKTIELQIARDSSK